MQLVQFIPEIGLVSELPTFTCWRCETREDEASQLAKFDPASK